jgi:CHAD domain-containing protein
MAVSMNETELKYDAPTDLALPRFDTLPPVARTSVPDEQELRADYFDTEDLRLLQAGITLRRRTGGSDAGWHLKLPAGPDTRTEIQLPLGRAVRQVPSELAELVRARIRGLPLQRVATLTTRRRTITLLSEDGASLAEIADDEVSGVRAQDPAQVVCWREVEIELTGGDDRLLAAADKALRAAGLRRSSRSAKLERVLGSHTGLRPGKPQLTSSTPAYQVVTWYLSEQAEALTSLDPAVRRGQPDSVHQMRVATRRLRSTLRTFPAVISRGDIAHLASELQWLGGVLGTARDAEVQAARMQRHLQQADADELVGPVAARVRAHFAQADEQARAAVSAALDSDRYVSLLGALDMIITDPQLGADGQSPAGQVLPAAVRSSYRKARRRMRRAKRSPPGPARETALHQARKAAKQARYAAEASAAVIGKRAARFARRMAQVQSTLGDLQDAVVARQLVRELASEADQAGESTFSYGLFYAREITAIRRLQARAPRVWKHAAPARSRSWMNAGA